jgi:hypothetical protein
MVWSPAANTREKKIPTGQREGPFSYAIFGRFPAFLQYAKTVTKAAINL